MPDGPGTMPGGKVPGEGGQGFAALLVEDPAHALGLAAVAFERRCVKSTRVTSGLSG